jgi:hypothetical protein
MNRTFARPAVLLAVALVAGGCRSAFAPAPVTRLSEAPQALHQATLVREVALRSGPDRLAPSAQQLAAGTAVTASDQGVRGYRRVRTSDGRTGYVEESAVQISAAAAPTPAPATQPGANAAEPAPAQAPAPAGAGAGPGPSAAQ